MLATLRHWSDQQDVAPHTAMCRVHLMQGHVRCVGSDRDECIVQHVASLMLRARMNPLRQKPSGAKELAQMKELQHTLKESGRMFYFEEGLSMAVGMDSQIPGSHALRATHAELRSQSLPSKLPAELVKVVEAGLLELGSLINFVLYFFGQEIKAKNTIHACMHACMHTYRLTETYTETCTETYAHTYIHIYTYIYIYTYIHMTYLHIYILIYIYIFIHMYIYTYIHIYKYTYIYTNIHIYTNLHI